VAKLAHKVAKLAHKAAKHAHKAANLWQKFVLRAQIFFPTNQKICTGHQKNIICTSKKHLYCKKSICTAKKAFVLQK